MKQRAFIGIALALVLALPAVAEESVDDIIAKNIEATGGRDAWKAIESARMTGKMSMGGMEAPMILEFKRPKKMRMEITLQGMTGVSAFDGESGWTLMPFMGQTEPQKMDPDSLKMAKEQAEFESPLMDYKEKGHKAELVGKEDVEGTEAYKVKLTRGSGDVDHYYIDTEHFLVFRQDGSRNMQGMEMEVTVSIGDYKEVEGLLFPHSMEVALSGGPPMQTLTMEQVEINVDLAEDRFAMPEPEPEAEAAPEAEAEAEGGGR